MSGTKNIEVSCPVSAHNEWDPLEVCTETECICFAVRSITIAKR